MKKQADLYSYRVFYSLEDKAHIATCIEFPSLSGHGNTPEKALTEIKKAVRASLKWMAEEGEEIPQPVTARAFSGKFNVRLPSDLHRNLSLEAASQHVSLNQLIVAKLSKHD